ncbi:glutaredoxin [Abortiporus biennis]|nr:glutaredoxin [Abortiporus biennis]
MAAKELVEAAVSENKITIFSKTWCPYCKRAKALFASKYPGVATKIYELDELDDGAEIQNYLAEKTGQRSVPNIFVNQKHVGGCDDIVSLESKGQLAPLVNV